MNPLHDIPDTGKYWFAIYYLHYKDEQVSNLTRTFIYITNYLYFGYNLSNLSTASLFTRDDRACTTKSGLVTKKKELPKTALDLYNLL